MVDNKKRNYLVYGFVVIILVAILAGIALTNTENNDSENVVVGAILPLSGPGSYLGGQAKNGMILAQEEINDNGGIEGRNLEIVFEDSKADGSNAVTAFQNLAVTKDLNALVTAFTAPTLALAPVSKENNLPLVTTITSGPGIPQEGDNIFRIFTTSNIDAPVMADYALNDLGLRKFGILHINDDYGNSYGDAFRETVESNGGEITDTETFARGDSDFKTQLTKLKESGADGIYVVGFDGHYINSFSQSVELGLEQELLGNWILASPNVISKMNDKKEGLAEKGYMTTPDYYIDLNEGKSADFNERFENSYNNTADAYSAFGYDTLMMLAQAMEEGTSAEEIEKGLLEVQYEGVIGSLSFDEEGEINFKLYPARVENGELVVLE